MRTSGRWALVVAILALWAVPVLAADPPADRPIPEGSAVPLVLLRQKSVQQELEISPENVKKIMDFTTKQYTAAQAAMKLPAADADKKFNELDAENKKFLADTLTEKQTKRLDQISMQLTGLMQLSRPEIVMALKLTDDQQKKFKEMQVEARKSLAELLSDKGKPGRNEKLAKLREETRTKILAELTPEQKTKVHEMVGEPFKGEIVFEEPEAPKEKK